MGGEHRREARVRSYAKVFILESRIPGYLRDLSRRGCMFETVREVPHRPGERVRLRVVVEEDPEMEAFELCVLLRWIRPQELGSAVGGEIEEGGCHEGAETFARLVAWYEEDAGEEPPPTSDPST
jgi:hypothetical protein